MNSVSRGETPERERRQDKHDSQPAASSQSPGETRRDRDEASSPADHHARETKQEQLEISIIKHETNEQSALIPEESEAQPNAVSPLDIFPTRRKQITGHVWLKT